MQRAEHDVLILGGGLAGLTLAIQLRQRDPSLDGHGARTARAPGARGGVQGRRIDGRDRRALFRRRARASASTWKRSSCASSASASSSAKAATTSTAAPSSASASCCRRRRGSSTAAASRISSASRRARWASTFRDGATVRGVDLGERRRAARGALRARGGAPHAIAARWVVDAAGRAGLIKRKLDLAQANDHDANAVWWRVDGHIEPQQWSDDPAWLARCNPPARWRSTNHMCGPGYWFWLIPLASNAHSLGIVCDAKMHPLDTMNTHEKAMDWLREHQPRRRRRGRQARARAAGLPVPAPLLLRLQAGVLRRPLGADRRSRVVPRSVLFAGQRLHRDQQHLHLRPDREGPRGPAVRAVRRRSTSSCTSRSTRTR